eukprot:gene5836-11149_t
MLRKFNFLYIHIECQAAGDKMALWNLFANFEDKSEYPLFVSLAQAIMRGLRVMFGILLGIVKLSVVLRNDVTWEDAQEEEAEEDVAEEEDAQKDVHKKMKQRRSNEELLRRWTDDTKCIHVNNSDCEWVRSAVFAGK